MPTPRFVRVASEPPRTPSFKVLTRLLAAGRWHTSDPVWWRPDERIARYVPLEDEQVAALDAEIGAGRPPGTASMPHRCRPSSIDVPSLSLSPGPRSEMPAGKLPINAAKRY